MRDRFFSKVGEKRPDGCIPWIGAKSNGVRGSFWDGEKLRVAPQVAWELYYGKPFPSGLFACHSCDNPECVNPEHIWPGTRSENAIDAIVKGIGKIPKSPHANKTHCKRGHEFTVENTRVYKGGRYCRLCARASRLSYYHASQLVAVFIIAMIPFIGCASSPVVSTPRPLEQRTLRVSLDHDGFEYVWFSCSKKFLGFCTEKKREVEYYDFKDRAVREKLNAMGFVLVVREQH